MLSDLINSRFVCDCKSNTCKDYLDARAFRDDAIPEEGADYEWVWNYATQSVELAYGIIDKLDMKANEIIKYLIVSAGVFVAAFLLGVEEYNAWICLYFVPAIVSSVVAFFFAILARQPSPVCLPPSIASAFQMASLVKSPAAKAALLGEFHLVHTSIQGSIAVKSRRVYYAMWWMFCTFAEVLLSMIAVSAFLSV